MPSAMLVKTLNCLLATDSFVALKLVTFSVSLLPTTKREDLNLVCVYSINLLTPILNEITQLWTTKKTKTLESVCLKAEKRKLIFKNM